MLLQEADSVWLDERSDSAPAEISSQGCQRW